MDATQRKEIECLRRYSLTSQVYRTMCAMSVNDLPREQTSVFGPNRAFNVSVITRGGSTEK